MRGVRLDAAPERTLVSEHVAHLHRDVRAPASPLQCRLNGEKFLIRDAPVRHGGPKQQAQHIRERLIRRYRDEALQRQGLHQQLVRERRPFLKRYLVREDQRLLRRHLRHLKGVPGQVVGRFRQPFCQNERGADERSHPPLKGDCDVHWKPPYPTAVPPLL